jgi:hypothetical protein
MEIRYADHATPSTRKKLALTLSTSGSRSVGIVRSRTKATEISLVFIRSLAVVVEFLKHLIAHVTKQFTCFWGHLYSTLF